MRAIKVAGIVLLVCFGLFLVTQYSWFPSFSTQKEDNMKRIKFTKIGYDYDEKSESMKYFEDGWVSILEEDLKKATIEKWGNHGYKIHFPITFNTMRTFEVKENPLEFLD